VNLVPSCHLLAARCEFFIRLGWRQRCDTVVFCVECLDS